MNIKHRIIASSCLAACAACSAAPPDDETAASREAMTGVGGECVAAPAPEYWDGLPDSDGLIWGALDVQSVDAQGVWNAYAGLDKHGVEAVVWVNAADIGHFECRDRVCMAYGGGTPPPVDPSGGTRIRGCGVDFSDCEVRAPAVGCISNGWVGATLTSSYCIDQTACTSGTTGMGSYNGGGGGTGSGSGGGGTSRGHTKM
jgi:hypothetical protein